LRVLETVYSNSQGLTCACLAAVEESFVTSIVDRLIAHSRRSPRTATGQEDSFRAGAGPTGFGQSGGTDPRNRCRKAVSNLDCDCGTTIGSNLSRGIRALSTQRYKHRIGVATRDQQSIGILGVTSCGSHSCVDGSDLLDHGNGYTHRAQTDGSDIRWRHGGSCALCVGSTLPTVFVGPSRAALVGGTRGYTAHLLVSPYFRWNIRVDMLSRVSFTQRRLSSGILMKCTQRAWPVRRFGVRLRPAKSGTSAHSNAYQDAAVRGAR
jgi:hypothetical protein